MNFAKKLKNLYCKNPNNYKESDKERIKSDMFLVKFCQ